MTLRTGELFAGASMLGMAVNSFFGSETAWFSDIKPAACKILDYYWPEIPNHGDITSIDFSRVEPVDILVGGSPCQDVSVAGRRAGIGGTRSGLWAYYVHAIEVMRPAVVVIENVRGLLTTPANRKEAASAADSDLGSGAGALGDQSDLILRAAGAFLGDLADLGYDAQWVTIPASSAGACHRRMRVFILAATNAAEFRRREGWPEYAGEQRGFNAAVGGVADGIILLPTIRTSDVNGAGSHGTGGDDLRTAVSRLPTVSASDTTGGAMHSDLRAGHSAQLIDRVLLAGTERWGPYAAAIAQQERFMDRPAPPPTAPNRSGNPRLSARFAEWMMMLPEGLVTNPKLGLSRTQMLNVLGDGCVPAQALLALRQLYPLIGVAA